MSRDGSGRVASSAGRGASALGDGSRWAAALGVERLAFDDPNVRLRLGEIVTVQFLKSNYGRRADPIQLRHAIDHGGALLPIDDVDLRLVSEVRQAASVNVAARAAKIAARETETRERDAADDLAACDIVIKNPGASTRVLLALVRRARACGTTRASAALARARLNSEVPQ